MDAFLYDTNKSITFRLDKNVFICPPVIGDVLNFSTGNKFTNNLMNFSYKITNKKVDLVENNVIFYGYENYVDKN